MHFRSISIKAPLQFRSQNQTLHQPFSIYREKKKKIYIFFLYVGKLRMTGEKGFPEGNIKTFNCCWLPLIKSDLVAQNAFRLYFNLGSIVIWVPKSSLRSTIMGL